MAALELRGVEKAYGAVPAVRGIDLAVPPGEFTVLVGPSGCGKSTLLRAIAGLEAVDAGRVLIGGEDVTERRPRDRDLAMVFQSYALYPYLTVFDNIAFGLRARRTPEAEVAPRVRRAAEMLAIGELLARRPRELSGGQRQRVAIGRAIVRDARLYLFDEPLSNLDAKLRDEMREEIKRLHRELGRTFLYVTHDQIEAMTLADRIVLLRDGRIEQAGPPLELYERPVNRFVAGFLGSPSMNMLPVVREGAALRLADGQRVALTPEQAAAAPEGPLVWGVRPEQFRLADPGPCVQARLEILQPTGSRLLAGLMLAGARVTAELEAHAGAPLDAELRLGVAVARTALFDPADGRAVWPRPEARR